VTRSGEFSPNGHYCTVGRFIKITEVARILGYIFPKCKFWINLDKNGLGYILGDFFINSSGHPALRTIL
jgi:hypothetical protein